MKLSGQQIKQIQDALLGAFDRDSLRMFVRIRLNEELDAITHNDNLTVVVFDLITWADQQGKVGALIGAAAAERPDNADLQQLTKEYAQWELAASKDVTMGGNPQAIFSEAYRLQMAGELTRAQVLYKEIANEPSLRLAVAEQLRAIDDELSHTYVDDHGVVNPDLVIAGHPLPPIQGTPIEPPKRGAAWLRPVAASLATLLLVGGTAVVAMQQPAIREAAQGFADAFLPDEDVTPTPVTSPEPDESPTATVDAAGARATPTATATEPESTSTPSPTATDTPKPKPPEAPPLTAEPRLLVSDPLTDTITVPSGEDVRLVIAELWSAKPGTPSDCASAFLDLSWQVKAPYPGGEELDVRHLIPMGGGNSESLGQGASGQVIVGICDELTLRNSSLEDYRVQLRYASGIY